MPFYRQYNETKVLFKNEEFEVIASMIGNIPDLITITPVPKNISRNDLVYPLLAKEFPELKVNLWWRPHTDSKMMARVEVI